MEVLCLTEMEYFSCLGGIKLNDGWLGICGVIGGCLCVIGDVLFDWKGKGNVKSGPSGMIDSNWLKMGAWRFKASILVAALGVPLYLLGFLGMSRQLAQSSPLLGNLFLVFAVIGSSGGLFIHGLVCCFPLISQVLAKLGVADEVLEQLVDTIFKVVKLPFMVMFCSLVIVTSMIIMLAMGTGNLAVPDIFYWLNPLMLMLIGWLFRLINKERFADLPGIVMPSVGIAMIGVMTVISAL